MSEYPRLVKGNCWDRVICATSPTEGFVVCYYRAPPPEYALKVADVCATWQFDNSEIYTPLDGPVGGYEYRLATPDWAEEWEVLRTNGTWRKRVVGEGPCTIPRVYRRRVQPVPEPTQSERLVMKFIGRPPKCGEIVYLVDDDTVSVTPVGVALGV